MWTRVKVALWHYIPVVLVGLAVLGYLRYAPHYREERGGAVVGKITPAPPPKVIEKIVEKIKRVQVPGPERIVYLDRDELAARLKMPELKEEKGVPVAVAEVAPHEGKTIAIAMTDNVTGDSWILTRKEAPAFFEWRKEWSAIAQYLFVGDHVFEADLRHTPIRVNARDGILSVEPFLFAGVDVDRDDNDLGARAGIGVQVRF